jgi:serine/threonine protein kinase
MTHLQLHETPKLGVHQTGSSSGLAASHAAGVAHRDLKPSNILVAPALEIVKITDFGIATLAEELFEEVAMKGDLTKSTSGTIKGALPYMAPEMMFRRADDFVGTEADIWSLGAMMFRLITGVYPFGEAMMDKVSRPTAAQLVAQWQQGDIQRSSRRTLSSRPSRSCVRLVDGTPNGFVG